jgi:hypothetical protein
MNWESAVGVYQGMNKAIAADSLLAELRDDFLEKAVRYARIRTDWELAESARRIESDEYRKGAHDALIDACNILSRAMALRDFDSAWRGQLGEDRKIIGDFACFVHCFLGLKAREG